MEKINFQNGVSGGTPINADNLNRLQDNIENAIPTKNVLWENTDVSAEFVAQTITLSSSDYDYLMIYTYRNYLAEGGGDIRTIIEMAEKNGSGEITFSDYLEVTRAWNRRYFISDDIKVTFFDCLINQNTNNITLVSYKIIGCKY